MVTRVITEILCTPHYHLDPENPVPATWSGNVQLGEVRRSLDLCQEHYEKLIGNLAETLETYGQPSTLPGPAPASRANRHAGVGPHALGREARDQATKEQCSICGGYYLPLGMSLHRNRAHGIKAG